jgi:hypothetical protein
MYGLIVHGADDYGRLLLYGNCTTCHFAKLDHSAPSLQVIKQRYKHAFPDKHAFVDFMSRWIIQPNQETSLMHDMIEKYGLMPELGYDEYTAKKVTTYIYETDF